MANTYYDSQLTAAEIEEVLEAINDILTPANNGKVLAISNGKFEARSVQWGGGSAVVQPLSVTQNGTYNPPSGVDGYAPVTVDVSGGGGGKQIEVTATVQNDAVVVDGCSIVSQPVIIDGKMGATSSQGLQISSTLLTNVCLEVDYKYVNGPSAIVFSLGGSNNSAGGVLVLSNSLFEFYANGSRIKRTDLNINFDQERHIKFIATMSDELYVVVDDVVILNASNNFVHNILNYCLSQNNIALGWNQSLHSEYNNGTFNNMKISFDAELPNT